MIITVLGCCRQESIDNNLYTITSIRNKISYTHNTKEILEVINFCKNGHLSPEETIHTFRTAIINNSPIYFTKKIKDEFENSDIFVIEISSKKTYNYKNKYVHHILYEYKDYNLNIKNDIIYKEQTDYEIEQDIIKIREILKRPIIIVGHISINNMGKRYDLIKLLENICLKHNILFLNPVKEIKKLGYDINNLVEPRHIVIHYNNIGKKIIKYIYTKFINMVNTESKENLNF